MFDVCMCLSEGRRKKRQKGRMCRCLVGVSYLVNYLISKFLSVYVREREASTNRKSERTTG